MSSVAIGIDLGTTNSCVGVKRNDRVEIIANDQGNRVTPSYVAFTEDEILVGDAAKAQAAGNPQNTVYDVKRLIGRKYGDAELQKMMDLWPFVVKNVAGNPVVEVEYQGVRKTFTPEEISAMVLGKMKETAEAYVGGPVTDAVITVPAYFNDSQRQATKDAGKIAGLNVLAILSEPTAAAIAYGVDQSAAGRSTVLIYDLGGGTFDVAVMTLGNGDFEVEAVNGDSYLGGGDFDNRLVKHFSKEFLKQYKVDMSQTPKALSKLRIACERTKRNLSFSIKEKMQIDSLFQGKDFEANISRVRLEELCKDLFEKTLDPVESVLQEAGMDQSEIDEVVLVGGSTRIPKIQALLKGFFNGKTLNQTINPEEAVAYGAAIHAASLVDNTGKDKVNLQDVCPNSLGINVLGGYTSKIIFKNTRIPTKKTKKYNTTTNNQTAVDIQVYDGERSLSSQNNLLGEFSLEGIPPAPKGAASIDVTFAIDRNGITKVTAVDPVTGTSKNITVTSKKGRLEEVDLQRMIGEAKGYREDGAAKRRLTKAKTDLESLCLKMKADASAKRTQGQVSEANYHTVDEACEEVLTWLEDDRQGGMEEVEEKSEELQAFYLRHVGR